MKFINDIKKVITDKQNDKHEIGYDSIIFNISSHGLDTSIVSSDGNLIKIFKIRDSLCQIKCLKGLPKIFVIDCCRNGDNSMLQNIKNMTNNNNHKGINNNTTNLSNDIDGHLNENVIILYGNPHGLDTKISKNDGSYFMKALCKIFRVNIKHQNKFELKTILVNVRKRLKEQTDNDQLVIADCDVKMMHAKLLFNVKEKKTDDDKNYLEDDMKADDGQVEINDYKYLADDVEEMRISNPLVIILGIPKYKNKKYLKFVEKDVKRLRSTWFVFVCFIFACMSNHFKA